MIATRGDRLGEAYTGGYESVLGAWLIIGLGVGGYVGEGEIGGVSGVAAVYG